MKPCCEADHVSLEYHLRELDKFRRLSDHKEIATARAMDYCARYRICPPEWLVAAANSLLTELLKREKTSRRGRAGSYLARFRQQLWDTERWFAVKEVHRVRSSAKCDDEVLKSYPDLAVGDDRRKFFEKRKKWLKQGTLECASKILAGRMANTGTAAIRHSYRKIENGRKRHPEEMVGAWFDDDFLGALGLQKSYDLKPGYKNGLYL
jgi:hypothetical protein